MPNNAIAKIKSALSRREVLAILAAVVFGALAFAKYQHAVPQLTELVMTDRTTYSLEVANNQKTQSKGLSGRASMAQDQGMLFTFPHEDRQCFWMKDMHFPLDMVWLDQGQRVVAIQRNVMPSTYPKTFCGSGPAMFVIELNAGQASRAGIQAGDILNF